MNLIVKSGENEWKSVFYDVFLDYINQFLAVKKLFL